VFPLASVLWVLLLLGFLMGIGKGAVDVGSNTLLQWVHGEHVGPFMNGLHFAYGLGALIAPLLLAQIILLTHEIYWVFWILAILIAPLACWLWFLPGPSPRSRTTPEESAPAPFLPVLVMVAAFVLYVGAELGFSNWIYTYAITLDLASPVTAAYLTSAYWASFTLARLFGIWISTRVRSRIILFIDFAICLASLALIAMAPGSRAMLWAGSICLGLGTASIFPTLIILAGERLRVTGTVTGLFLLGSGIGSMFLPWLIGNAFTATKPEAMINILFVDMVLGLLAVIVFVFGGRFFGERQAVADVEP
jgi:FHS family Na+ dependent glucose MFS transporter 1